MTCYKVMERFPIDQDHWIELCRTGRTWSVFGCTATGPNRRVLLEGGFFGHATARECAEHWQRECIQEAVEQAERKAGWDGQP